MNNEGKKTKLSLLAQTTAMCGPELLKIEKSRIARNRNTQGIHKTYLFPRSVFAWPFGSRSTSALGLV
jgi:hypothetical protein